MTETDIKILAVRMEQLTRAIDGLSTRMDRHDEKIEREFDYLQGRVSTLELWRSHREGLELERRVGVLEQTSKPLPPISSGITGDKVVSLAMTAFTIIGSLVALLMGVLKLTGKF